MDVQAIAASAALAQLVHWGAISVAMPCNAVHLQLVLIFPAVFRLIMKISIFRSRQAACDCKVPTCWPLYNSWC